MTLRSAAIARAVAAEIAARAAVLDAADGPDTVTLVVKLAPNGRPVVLLFRPEWASRLTSRHEST